MSIKLSIPLKVGIIYSEFVLLPGVTKTIEIVKERNMDTLHHYMNSKSEDNKFIGIIPSTDSELRVAEGKIGTVAFLSEIVTKTTPSKLTITVTGLYRFKITEIKEEKQIMFPITVFKDKKFKETEETTLYWHTILSNIPILLKRETLLEKPSPFFDKGFIFKSSRTFLVDACADIVAKSFEERLNILETTNAFERLKKTALMVKKYSEEIQREDPKTKTRDIVATVISTLPSQVTLGVPSSRASSDSNFIKEFKKRIKDANLPEQANKLATDQLHKLERMGSYNPEHYVVSSHLELILSLPWNVSHSKEIDLEEARKCLDKDHYSLEKVKKRILEYLAVRQLKNNNLKGPILCFVGPPGVGKTSVGKSIANILGRGFQRIGLGGVSNPSEIRGHRMAYVGSKCGRILLALKNAGTKNPVILLDEVDKMVMKGQGRGDPSSALLEVLDPEQNSRFVDHYLSIPFDLSQVIFLATANNLRNLPPALIDRMEIIRVTGYTIEEKCHILKQYLLPKQIDLHGLKSDYLVLPDKSIDYIVRRYTREAGVRNAERSLAALCRYVALVVASKKTPDQLPILLSESEIKKVLGTEKYHDSLEIEGCTAGVVPGVVIGLAVRAYGGSVIMVELNKFPFGQGELILTGQLGKVLSESATIALNWLRANAALYGLVEPGEDIANDVDIHLHIPEGSIVKEGPSAGIVIAVALLSLFSNIPVVPKLALTGEISLQGRVLPVGGLKEKILSAARAGINKVILPKRSEYMMDDIPKEQIKELEFHFVDHMSEVIEIAFDGKISPRKCLTSKL